MKSPDRSSKVTRFLAAAAIGWFLLIHGVAGGFLGLAPSVGWVLSTAPLVVFSVILAYMAWEFRQAKPLGEAPAVQDVSLLMLTRPKSATRPIAVRRSRMRLSGPHPVLDRVASLHLPTHIDRRHRRRDFEVPIGSSPTLSEDRFPVTPSAN